ncbi:hypothetical protein TcWFU_003901 [Taenia crassiceps]|uniref:Uncharacterized protein n=1 Tax=Taenia crassiceps TaxID=6207 RepID=A0ABR4QKK6_9CEST
MITVSQPCEDGCWWLLPSPFSSPVKWPDSSTISDTHPLKDARVSTPHPSSPPLLLYPTFFFPPPLPNHDVGFASPFHCQ